MLQSVLNSAARLVLNIPKFSHISAAIRDELHWLPIREGSTSRSPLWSVTAWLVLSRNTWRNCAILLAQPAVGRQCLRSASRIVTWLFRGFGFKHSAIGPSLSRAPKFGTLFRSGSDNRVTIYCFSNRNWKRICFSSSERFCGSISNEGPYRFSTLLLLLDPMQFWWREERGVESLFLFSDNSLKLIQQQDWILQAKQYISTDIWIWPLRVIRGQKYFHHSKAHICLPILLLLALSLYLVPFSRYSTLKFSGFDLDLWPLGVTWGQKYFHHLKAHIWLPI